jgi:hypothetical protein
VKRFGFWLSSRRAFVRLFYVCTYDDEVLEFGYCCDDTTLKESKTFWQRNLDPTSAASSRI